jgi:hypothetical protein
MTDARCFAALWSWLSRNSGRRAEVEIEEKIESVTDRGSLLTLLWREVDSNPSAASLALPVPSVASI